MPTQYKGFRIAVIVLAVLAVLIVWYRYKIESTKNGSEIIDLASFEQLSKIANRDSEHVRLIVLLSPN